ncbi:MAG: cytochrome [Rhodocyclales bacterium]|nr:cytochrome [Rhodocyclales bacterium]
MTPNAATVHPAWLRITHWLNVIAVVILVLSGWRIYNASPIFDFRIPAGITLGGWLGGALLWHFAAMWLLVVNGIIYIAFNVFTGRFARKFFPLRPREVLHDILSAIKGKLAHDDLQHYNALQKLAYLFVIVDATVIVISGMAIWKSVQFPLLRELMGGYDNARIVHFVGMAALVAFIVVHVVMVALVPKTLVLMIRGK